jgi:hypothetical protein
MGVQQALSLRRPNAGIVKATLKEPGRAHVREVVKVKAHVDEQTVEGPLAKRHARGNALADEAAKLGVLAHPQLPWTPA